MTLAIEILNKPHAFHSLPEPMPLTTAVEQSLAVLNETDRKAAISAFYKYALSFAQTAQFSSSSIVVIDNNILDSMKKVGDGGRHDTNTAAAFCFFDFLVNAAKLKVTAALTPVIMYEFAGKKLFTGRRHFEQNYRSAISLIGKFGVPVCVIGVTNYKNAKGLMSDIVADEAEILKAIKVIKNGNWSVDLKAPVGVRIPFSFAAERAPKLRLKYLSKEYTEYLLAHLIERLIYDEKENDARARKLVDKDRTVVFARLSNIKRDSLKGLGDVELLTLCDIRAQFASGETAPRFGLTLDQDLQEVLKRHSNLVLGTGPMSLSEGLASLPDILTAVRQQEQSWDSKLAQYGSALNIYLTETMRKHFAGALA